MNLELDLGIVIEEADQSYTVSCRQFLGRYNVWDLNGVITLNWWKCGELMLKLVTFDKVNYNKCWQAMANITGSREEQFGDFRKDSKLHSLVCGHEWEKVKMLAKRAQNSALEH